MVAHTRKLKDESEIPDATNIMGSSHIRNLCDNIICVWRNRYKEKLIEEGKTSDDELINNGFAVRYMGENKDKVKDLHLKNRKRLIDEGLVKMSYKDAGIL